MVLGRNDPCYCGSGKKYKKSCLSKDQRKPGLGEEAASPGAPPTRRDEQHQPERPRDPRMEALNARWSEFEAADYEGRFALFAQTLDDPDLMDGEMAFDMLSKLFSDAIEHGERDRFDARIEDLRARRPEVYAEEAHYLLSLRITNALVAGRFEELSALVRNMALLAGEHIDPFERVESQLAYHGQLSTLVEAMRWATQSTAYGAATVRERVAARVYHRLYSRRSTRSLTVAALYAAEEDWSIQFMNDSG